MQKHISQLLKGEEFIVIAGGTRYVIASEDAPRYPRGHGGNPILFKLKDSGKVIYSTNVWNTGEADEADTADILEYKDWKSVGVSDLGALKENSNAYVYSEKLLITQ